VRGRLESTAGFTLIELIVVMTMLSIVLGVVVTSFTSALAGEHRSMVKATAEENARMSLNRIRLDIHCATGVNGLNERPGGGWTITLNENNTSDTQCAMLTLAPGSSGVQWCTIPVSENRWRLYRENGLDCDGVNSTFMVDYLVEANPWTLVPCVSRQAEALGVRFYVNVNPNKLLDGYTLQDEIALRNASRQVVCPPT
jgi:prepilin-type N-terminal cleavage/methylation domain-containing protein